MVGYCHGLPCIAAMDRYLTATASMISDPNRKDFLLIYPAVSAPIIYHGFGFDRSANKYKLVSIFRTSQIELNFVVYTLGTKSWRNITATSTPISGLGGGPVTNIRAPPDSDKSAIYCAPSIGCLVWKIIATLGGAGSNDIEHDNSNAVSNEMEMLLLFNLHNEKFQFIQLPANITTGEQQNHLLVDYPHLLEFKGSPCIALVEKISGNGIVYPHRCCGDHQGSGGSCCCCCCCCCKVHLYVLKDNVKQVWVKEESFDVRISSTPTCSRKLAPEPCCFCFSSTTTPPTRIYSFSDQMLLYWFKGKYLQVYNLRSGNLQLVRPFRHREDVLFRAKIKEPRHIYNSGDNDIYCSNLDYQLHCHEENFVSLQTFIPEGVEEVDADDFSKLDLEPCLGFMFIYRRSKVYYPFFS
ncbi:uncharacterized protein LOC113323404 [Papaver somniferum]|uniref:uncharacterized protein LOC113323404 n=1 Tax=Papaver somniferum TaxID=3469 RepID=UPI000E6FD6FD|nr:uncharacterized protein LOC113323404 [Papaver somniferum]